MLTLSKGEYFEVYTNDTLQRIGSVVFNTVTNKVQYFILGKDINEINRLQRNKQVSIY